jgi:uncharacterized repeat protein (TIGR01451 family)
MTPDCGRTYGGSFSPRTTAKPFAGIRAAVLRLLLAGLFPALVCILGSPLPSQASVPSNTLITNQAQANYLDSGQNQIRLSNQDMLTANPAGTPATISFYRYAGGAQPDLTLNIAPTSFSPHGSEAEGFTPLAPPVEPGYPPLNLGSLKLRQTDLYHAGDPIFIVVNDPDHNIRPNQVETIVIEITSSAGDKELLRLVETGDDTGIFAGYIQTVPLTAGAAANHDGKLTVSDASQVIARYKDTWDKTDTLTAAALVDPTGRVFDSLTGLPVDGATVTLMDETTGKPATVIGDDGASAFPSTITTGSTTTDAGGRRYDFAPGGYRFPLIFPGTYRLVVTPPAGYKAPSTVPDGTLQTLAGAPYALSPSSRGEAFIVYPGPILHIDVPLDPVNKGLWMEKIAGKATAAIGDFVPFRMKVTNLDPNHVAANVVVTDVLPHGMRYRRGSLRIGGVVATDPLVADDGVTLRIALGNLATRELKEISYVTEVVAGARTGSVITNRAKADGTGVTSNNVAASITVTEDFFTSRSFLMGTVSNGACGSEMSGIEGVRVYLENGTYVVTDKKGMFHFEGVRPGSHVVQLDIDSLPEGYRVVPCEENSRFAGRAFSQFVDLQGGALWRVDFHVARATKLNEPAPVKAGPGEVKDKAESVTAAESAQKESPAGEEAAPAENAAPELVPDAGGAIQEPAGTARNQEIPPVFPAAEKPLGTGPEQPRLVMPEIVLHPHFPTFGAELSAADKERLDELAILLVALKIEQFAVTGHTDNVRIAPRSRGIFRDNKELSLARAKNIGRYLMDKLHLPPSQLTIHGMGDSRPLASNRTEEGRAQNRRVEIRVQTVKHAEASRFRPVRNDDGLKAEIPGPAPAVKGVVGAESRTTANGRKEMSSARPAPLVPTTGSSGGAMQEDRVAVSQVPAVKIDYASAERGDAAMAGQEDTHAAPAAVAEPQAVSTEGAATAAKQEEVIVVPPQPATANAGKTSADGQEPGAGSEEDDEQLPAFDMAWIENAQAGREWVWPPPVYFPPMPSTHIALKYHPADKVVLSVNGAEVHPVLLEKVLKHPNGSVAVSYWRGVHLIEGDNRITAVIQPAGNGEKITLERVLHVSTSPVRAEIVPELSRLVADGKTPPVIAIRMFDKDDFPIRPGMTGKFTISVPYETYVDPEKTKLNELAAKEEVKYVVGKEGVALIRLQPTNRTGEATVTLPYANNREEQYRVWLTPQKRDWILVGLAEGTAGYNTVSGHMENLRTTGSEEQLYENGKVAFFAKGTIQGKWLLTMAYDSSKSRPSVGNNLFQTIDPNAFYTLYGDNTQQQYDAASARKLYLKIERDQFYALFGDFNTGLTVTELSRYSRSLNGLKSEYQSKNYEFNVFASETDQSFAKDEIRGDGTSGLYRLSRRNILINSEKITIDVRDRFRSEVVVSSRPLTRYMDYTIDYDAGTIFFKEPITSRDQDFNPIFIVVDYETQDVGQEALNYGGRAGLKFLDEKVKTGVTYIHEEQLTGKGESYGADASWQISGGTRLKAEVARTDSNFAGSGKEGNAYLTELEHRTPKIDSKIYYRELGEGFGLGQQSASEAGTRKFGADASYKVSEAITLNSQAYRQYNLATGGVRDLVEGKVAYSFLDYSTRLGLRHASDTLGDGSVHTSEQLTTGATWLTLKKKLSLHVDHDQSIGGNSNIDFPTRTTFGADYKITEKTVIFGQQELTSGAGADTNATRVGVKAAPWQGGTVNSAMERSLTENSERVFALVGLKQTWKITDQWSVDGGLDRSQTIKRSGNYQFNVNAPSASGHSEDFTAVSLGNTYMEKKWNWSTRLEVRTADTEDKWGFLTAFIGEPREGWGWSTRLQIFSTDSADGSDKVNGDLRFGVVYRPLQTRWIVLDRLDLRYDRQRGTTLNSESRRVVNNLNGNCKLNGKTQLSLQYGAKYVLETIDDADYKGYTDLIGIEGRYDLTKEWDLGLRGSALHSWNSGQISYSTGPSVGYNIVKNAWISLGYNVVGFTDKDFSAADFTAQGPFVRFRFKFDQNSVREAAQWINRE